MIGIRTFWAAEFLVLLGVLLPQYATAFHEGGVGYCEGCHLMHRTDEAPADGTPLLRKSDPSSTCLSCHAEPGRYYNVLSTDGSSYTPAGDFYWLKKSFSWAEAGASRQSPGSSHGHNLDGSDYGLKTDEIIPVAPGGSMRAAEMGCHRCHDPHGRRGGETGPAISVSGSYGAAAGENSVAGNYRLLGGVGFSPMEGVVFSEPAPVAVTSSDDWRETDSRHPAYGSGMSEWCANCHAAMLAETSADNRKHPAGREAKLTAGMLSRYNAYLRTGDLSGDAASAYLALVPFEVGTTDLARLSPVSTAGPENGATVMCLTCHRAHASAFTSCGRWDFEATLLAESHPAPDDAGALPSDRQHSYYGRDLVSSFGPYQRQFCNKCHPMD